MCEVVTYEPSEEGELAEAVAEPQVEWLLAVPDPAIAARRVAYGADAA